MKSEKKPYFPIRHLPGRYRPLIDAVVIPAVFLSIAGCARIAPGHHAIPDMKLAGVISPGGVETTARGDETWPKERWWVEYGDGQLTSLIDLALKTGPSLQIAAARIDASRTALEREQAENGVDVSLRGSADRLRYSSTGLYPPPIGGTYYTDTTVGVSATYDFDWWGKHRALIKASLGEVDARKAEYAQAEQTLAAAIAQTYFNLQANRERIGNLEKIIEIQTMIVDDTQKRIQHGLLPRDDQRKADAGLATLKRAHIALEGRGRCELESLRALIGSETIGPLRIKPGKIPAAIETVPAHLGFELLARRPDLHAARLRVESSLNRIDAVKAAFYPDINLSGFFGFDTVTLDDLLKAPSRTLSFGPSLYLPLFDSGRLNARLDQAEARRNEMIADYNQSVFSAVRDVTQAGITLNALNSEIEAQDAFLGETRAMLSTAEARYRQGLVGRSSVLSARRAVLDGEDTRMQLENQRIIADLALVKALGGGYRASVFSNKTSEPVNTKKGPL